MRWNEPAVDRQGRATPGWDTPGFHTPPRTGLLVTKDREKTMGPRFRRFLIRLIVLFVFATGTNALAVPEASSVVAANQVVELTFTADNPSRRPIQHDRP